MDPNSVFPYYKLPLEIKALIARHLDIPALIQIGKCDPSLFTVESILTDKIRNTSFEKRFWEERTKKCESFECQEENLPEARVGLGPPPFYELKKYQANGENNKAKIRQLMSLADMMDSLNTDFKETVLHQLAMHVITQFPPHAHEEDIKCRAHCNAGQPVWIDFLYKGTGRGSSVYTNYTIDLDGWNLLVYMGAKMEFRGCSSSPHFIEKKVHPLVWKYTKYYYTKLPRHNLIYKSIISGMELASIYSNIKNTYEPRNTSMPPSIHVETIIIYSLEGAMALFAMLEDEKHLHINFGRVIYDPRSDNIGLEPIMIEWRSPCFRLNHHNNPIEYDFPGEHSQRNPTSNRETIYHLMPDHSWKTFHTYRPRGPSGRTIVADDMGRAGSSYDPTN